MGQGDKYYLKKGRLELSALDEMEGTVCEETKEPQMTREPRIKLTEDIYNTLQAMGKFLTKKNGNGVKGIDPYLEGSWYKPYKQKDTQVVKEDIEVQIKAVYEQVSEQIRGISLEDLPQELVLQGQSLKEQLTAIDELCATIEMKKVSIFDEEDEENHTMLSQSKIDDMLLAYFGDNSPKSDSLKKLKETIDLQKELIKNNRK